MRCSAGLARTATAGRSPDYRGSLTRRGWRVYRDAGSFTIYAGCANEAVGEVIDLVVEELRQVKHTPVPQAELQRAKDHLKGSLMLSLENTASRMSHLARQEIYFDRQFGLDETLQGIERVT